MRYLKKTILILMLLVLASCSPDPRVAPLKMFIVNITGDHCNVMYDENYRSRVIYMDIGDTALLEVITNRLYNIELFDWKSNVEYVATVVENEDANGVLTAHNYGVSKVTVSARGCSTIGECFVIVQDKNSPSGLFVEVAHVDGLIEALEGYTLYATSVQDLSSKSLNLKFTTDSSLQIKKVEWYVEGHLESNEKNFCLSLDTFGVYTVNCIVYYESNGGVLLPCGTSSINITAKYI